MNSSLLSINILRTRSWHQLTVSAMMMTLSCLTTGQAWAENRDIMVVNTSDNAIVRLYVSPQGSRQWGPDRLQGLALRPTDSRLIDLDHRGTHCYFEFKAIYANGRYDRGSGNLCHTTELDLLGRSRSPIPTNPAMRELLDKVQKTMITGIVSGK